MPVCCCLAFSQLLPTAGFCPLPSFKFAQKKKKNALHLPGYKHWERQLLVPVSLGEVMPTITLTFHFVKAKRCGSIWILWEVGTKVELGIQEIDGVTQLWKIKGRENGSGLEKTFRLRWGSDTHDERGRKEDWVGGVTGFSSVLKKSWWGWWGPSE